MSVRRGGRLMHSGNTGRRRTGRLMRLAALAAAGSLALGIWAPSVDASAVRWPAISFAGVRAWLTSWDGSPAVPGQVLGTAGGSTHQVPASVTQTRIKSAGTAPGTGTGQLPAYQAHGPSGPTGTSGPDVKAPGFNPVTSRLLAADSTATQNVYQNANGTFTRDVYAGPVNYQTSAGSWAPIDTTLTSSKGRWSEKGNSLGVSFAPASDAPVLGSMDLGVGQSYGFGLAGAATVTGTQSGSSVTYAGVLPDTDLRETAGPAGLNESLVLDSAAGPSSWVFPLTLTGLTPSLNTDGSVSLVNQAGTAEVVIPAGQAWDSATASGHTGLPANEVPTSWQVLSYDGGPALQLSLPAGWLSDPSRVFPVTVDPSGNEGVTGTTWAENGTSGANNSGSDLMLMGNYGGGSGNRARTFLDFGNLGDSGSWDYYGDDVTAASLDVWDSWAWYCGAPEPFNAYGITSSWSLTSISWPGPSTGGEMGTVDDQAPSIACTDNNVSGYAPHPDPYDGGWMDMTLNSFGVAVINNWTLGNDPNLGVALEAADETNDYQWKQLDGYNSPHPPYLALTYAPDVPPQINATYPQNNYNTTSLTPELQATGSDADNWPDPLGYYVAVYSSSGALVANSTMSSTAGSAPGAVPTCSPSTYTTGWLPTADWTVPEEALTWGQTYSWEAVDCDGLDLGYSQPAYFTTQVPQPTVGQATQNDGPLGVRPGGSDYTTSATDANVSTVGPSLSIQRDYDSDNFSTAGAFGAGWSSVLDMKVTPGLTDGELKTDTMVVTYPDGSQVGFGENYGGTASNATFAAPEGRYATLALVNGVYTLTDKNDTIYTFGQSLSAPWPAGSYGITSIKDALGNTLTFGWNSSGQITQMTSSASGRSLTIAWTTGAAPLHVASVSTSPVTGTSQSTDLTWTYGYSGNELTSVCPPISTTACTTYRYTPGTDYPNAVLATGPHSYWRLGEASGTTAASSVLANEQADAGAYTNVTLGQPGPLPGSTATAAGFNGSSSYVTLPPSMLPGASYQSISLWFKTTNGDNEVLFSTQQIPLSATSSPGPAQANLYIGQDGKLVGEFWGLTAPLESSSAVTDGNWHLATLVKDGSTASLYLDNGSQPVATAPVSPADLSWPYVYVGAGDLGAGWPDEKYQDGDTGTYTATYFNGSISDMATWNRALTGPEISGLYQAGTAAGLLTQVTRPSGSISSQVAYSTATGAVTQVTDGNGGVWKIAAPTMTGSSQGYVASVLRQAPADYRRLADNPASATAVDQVSGGGTATYSTVTQGVAGPFADSTADSFNGTSSYLQLPATDEVQASPGSVEMWFQVPAGNTTGGVLWEEQGMTLGQPAASYTPALYVGPDGKLHGGFYAGSGSDQIVSPSAVNDGKWHMVVLTSSGTGEALYLDGAQIGTLADAVVATSEPDVYVGAGHVTGWPDPPSNPDGYFTGSISEVAVFATQLSAAQVTAEWQAAAQVHASSQGYVTSVLHQVPADYWRLADAAGAQTAVNQVSGGSPASYSNVTQGVAGPFADSAADSFNGTSSYMALPSGVITGDGNQSVSLWFKATTAGGVLLSASAASLSAGSTTGNYIPVLYIDSSGDLEADSTGSCAPIKTATTVDDGKWHNVVLTSTAAGTQTLYVDGAQVGQPVSGTLVPLSQPNVYAGVGFIGACWPNEPNSGKTATPEYFSGSLSDLAVYNSDLSPAQVTAQWQAAQWSRGVTPAETQTVTDPGGHTISYQMDPLNGDRIIAQTDALGNTTTFSYDVGGFQDSVTDPDGNVTLTGHDSRGNMVSQATCQDWEAGNCSTEYMTYYLSTTNPSDPRNDLMLTDRGPGSASATDPTYLTTNTYTPLGEPATATGPPVPGFPAGRSTTYTYTTASSTAYNSSGGASGTTPPGLPLTETTSGGAVTSYEYYSDGDLYQVTDPDGMRTTKTYDGVGRKLTQTEYPSTYPAGLTTTYAYDQMGRVVTETEPTVTDPAPGTPHTAQITTSYDPDGDALSQTVTDTTPASQGGDPARTVTRTYNSYDQLTTSTDGAGNKTTYTYDAYGNKASQTDPAGNVTNYTHDPDGDLLTTVLASYAGTATGSCQTVSGSLVESSRTYDPAGQLASVTNANCDTTAYTYTGNGLVSTITQCTAWTASTGCGGSTYTEQANTYNAAGQLITRVTGNGKTTTDYVPDAAGRTQSHTLDPAGLDRTTAYSYTPDDAILTEAVSGAGGTPASVTGYTYDPMGNLTSQTVNDDNSSLAPSGWWPLTQPAGSPSGSSAETYAPDQSGNGNTGILSSGATWASGGGVTLNGSSGDVTTTGPAVNTAGSYAVSAWVNLASIPSQNEAVASQDGTTDSGFYLGFNSQCGCWALNLVTTDTTNPAFAPGVSGPAAQAGVWTHLVALYNAATQTASLYVNGTLAGTSSYTGWDATGPFSIGQALYDGGQNSQFGGTIENVQTYSYALSASQVSQLYGDGRSGTPLGENLHTTSWALDSRGLPVSMTDPDGNSTSYVYDQAGQLAETTDPVVTTQVHGVGPLAVAPVSYTGYNTFGEPVLTKDPDGNEVFTAYDNNGRPVSVTEPNYTPPDGTGQIAGAHTTTAYNSLSEVTSRTDPLGNVTSYTYDQLGDETSMTTPAGTTSFTYDGNGDQLSATAPTGAVTDATYDFLGRPLTSTQVERYPSAASYTTTDGYGANSTGPWLTSVTTPDGVATSYGRDAAGETTSVTDGAGDVTSYAYDPAGRQTKATSPDGTYTTTSYDEAGNPVGQAGYSSAGSLLRADSATFDADGNQLTATDYRGNTTSYTYNAEDQLTSEVQPVTSSSSITTSLGYDAGDNPTLYTDGNGNNWWTTYNTWNLPESQIEPTTAAAPTAADSTFTTSYNADGNPVQVSEPGGITITDSYNTMQQLTGQSGTGASATTTTRSFGYNADGQLTSASAPAGSNTYTYDDRGLLLSASGPSGTSSFAYNGDGLTSSVTDAAGTTSYTYGTADRLASLADPATGTTLSYSYNPNSQVSQVSDGASGDVQLYGYSGLHQLTSDTLQTHAGATVASISYGYDADGNLTSKNTTGFGSAANNAYTYNEASQLTSWNNGTSTTNYAYDGAGNRTQAGSKTFTYDARDEVTSDGTSTYAYAMAGTLASVSGPGGTTSYTSDAFGQTITAGSQTYAYDALGRLVTGTGGFTFSYDGASPTLASDGTSTYTWNPGGTSLVGIGVPGSPSTGVLALTDAHTDVVGNVKATASALTGSATYDPLGNQLTTSTMAGHLGYQSAWTSQTTSQVHMGARWYNPATGQFTSRDTTNVKPVPNAAAANPFAYAADNPLTGTDPTGQCPVDLCGTGIVNHGVGNGSTPGGTVGPAKGPIPCGTPGGQACQSSPKTGLLSGTDRGQGHNQATAQAAVGQNPGHAPVTPTAIVIDMPISALNLLLIHPSLYNPADGAVTRGFGPGLGEPVYLIPTAIHKHLPRLDCAADPANATCYGLPAQLNDGSQSGKANNQFDSIELCLAEGPILSCGHFAASDNNGSSDDESGQSGDTASINDGIDQLATEVARAAAEAAEKAAQDEAEVEFRLDTEHIFRDALGHLAQDTAENRALIQDVVRSANLRSVITLRDGATLAKYTETLPDGTQVWAEVRNGTEITNGGLNATPR